MLTTVAVEVVQQGVPANRHRTARPVRGRFHRYVETLEADGYTSLLRTEGNAPDLSRPGPHRQSERWS
jgi:hypothetical protein